MTTKCLRILPLVAFGVASGVAVEADAATRTLSAGAACQSANGGASAMFVRGAQYLSHVGASDQYVVCLVPLDIATSAGQTVTTGLSLSLSGKAGTTTTCVAHLGSWSASGNPAYTVARSRTFATDDEFAYLSFGADINDAYPGMALAITCRMTPGSRLGGIFHTYTTT